MVKTLIHIIIKKKKIGSGATSTVYKVKKENEEIYYALKVAEGEDDDDGDNDDDDFDVNLFKKLQRFLSEYELLNSIDQSLHH